MKIKKFFGYCLLLISSLLILDQLWALTVFAFEQFGFWGGILNFSLLPITFFLHPLLRLFLANAWSDLIYVLVIAGLLFLSFKFLNEKSKKIEKPKNLTLDKDNLPIINGFDLIKALFSVPFSYYLIVFSAGLTTAIAALLIGVIYYVESSLINRVHVGILFLLGLGALIGILVGLYSMIQGLRKKRGLVIGFELRDQNSPVFLLVKEVAEKLKTSMPDHILISFGADLHVHQVKSLLIDGSKIAGKTLTFGYPYLKHFSLQEAKAVVTHELAHFTGRDTLFSLYVFPTYKSFRILIANLASLFEPTKRKDGKEDNTPWMAIPNFLSLLIISRFYERFSKLIARIDRIREARADIIGAICYGTNSFKNGLILVSKIEPLFSRASERDYWEFVTKHGKVFTNYFEFFDKTYLGNKEIKKLMDRVVESDTITSELDTHFSLKERFEYLPDNNDAEYKKDVILDSKTQKEYEQKLSELYGTYIGFMSQRLSELTKANSKQVDDQKAQ